MNIANLTVAFSLLLSACLSVVEGDETDPADDDSCELACETYGHCEQAPPPEDCGNDELWQGCHAGSVEDCEQSQACAEYGLCCFRPHAEGECNSCSKC